MRPLRLADDGDGVARGDAQALALLKIGIDTDAAIRMDVQDLARERRTVALQAHGEGRDARERSPRLVYAQVMGEEVARGLSIDLDDGAVVCHARDLHFRPEGLPAEGRKHLDMKILAHEDEGEESPRHPVPRQVDHDARSIDLIRQEPAEEHDVFRRIRQDVQKLLDAQDLRGEKDADRLDLLLPRDRLDQSARRRQCVGLSVKRQGDDARRGEEREGHGGSRRIRQIVLAAPHPSIGEATLRCKPHDLCVRENLPRRGLEIPHRIDGKLRREKGHEKIRNALHGNGDPFCLLQTESKIVFFVKQRRKLLQGGSSLSFTQSEWIRSKYAKKYIINLS